MFMLRLVRHHLILDQYDGNAIDTFNFNAEQLQENLQHMKLYN